MKCEKDECRMTSFKETLAGVPVTMVVYLGHGGRLTRIFVVFRATEYEHIASAIAGEFGQAFFDSHSMHDGVELRITTWDDAAGNSVFMERTAHDPDIGQLSFHAKDGGL
jgi:hypothetical protein